MRSRRAVTGARLLVCIALAICMGLAVVPSAKALTGHWYDSDYVAFSGVGCNATDTVTIRLPAGAFDARPVRPLVGRTLNDVDTGERVARVTDVSVERSDSGHLVLRITA